MDIDRVAGLFWTAMLTLIIATGERVSASDIFPGFDLSATPPTFSSADLSDFGFGVIMVEGVPLDGASLGITDTIVERKEGISLFPRRGKTTSSTSGQASRGFIEGDVNIEVVALHLRSESLVSLDPLGGPFVGVEADLHIIINKGGVISGLPNTDGMLLGTPSIGLMKIRHDSPPDGGTFDACFGEIGEVEPVSMDPIQGCVTVGVGGGGVFAQATFTVQDGDPADAGDIIVSLPAPREVVAVTGGIWSHTPRPVEPPPSFPAGDFYVGISAESGGRDHPMCPLPFQLSGYGCHSGPHHIFDSPVEIQSFTIE